MKSPNINSVINREEWKGLLNHSSTATFFQTPECYDFYLSLSFLKPFVFGVSENGKLVGLVCGYIVADGGKIKQYFSRRAIIQGGILLADDISNQALKLLLCHTRQQLKKEAIYIEIRNNHDYSKYKEIFEKAGFDYQPYLNIKLKINSQKSPIHELSKSKQRELRTALRKGVYWEETDKPEDVEAFYQLLKELYKNKVKKPLFPLDFFQKLVETTSGKLLVVKHQNEIIGGTAGVCFEHNVFYEWFKCGSIHVNKKYYPSVMATWAGIEYTFQNNMKYFDFMGAGKPDENYGVREFKSKFGGELIENGRFIHLYRPLLYNIGKIYINFKFDY